VDNEDENQRWAYPESVTPRPPKPSEPSQPTVSQELSEAVHEPAARPRVADELLLLFGRLAAAILFAVVLLTGLTALFQPEKDLSGVYSLLNTQLSLIIGAVLGYAAHPAERNRD
jgi:hypothetical protein